MDTKLILIFLFIIFAETGAHFFLQKQITSDKKHFLILGVILYSLVGLGYYGILTYGKKLAIANSLFNAGSEIMVALLGFAIFGQKLSYIQILGLIFVIVGINMLA